MYFDTAKNGVEMKKIFRLPKKASKIKESKKYIAKKKL